MNVERLHRVKMQILAEPDRFDMEDYATPILFGDEVCGTACCIGGFAALDAGFIRLRTSPREGYATYYDVTSQAPPSNGSRDVFDAALNLSPSEADRLFLTSHWPGKFFTAYAMAKTHTEQAEIAANRIDHFIRTRGRE